MYRHLKPISLIQSRQYKNFGHKREPEATVTVLWHGFLTFTFIGLVVEWKRIYKFIFEKETTEDLFSAQPIDANER